MPDNYQEEKLRQEILGDARTKAERFIARAKVDADKAAARAQTAAEEKRAARLKEAEEDAAARCNSIAIDVQRETRRHWLLKREEKLNALFQAALKKAVSATGDARKKSLLLLAKEAVKAIGPVEMTVEFPEADGNIITLKALQELAAELFGAGNSAAFTLKPGKDAAPGLIFATADGRKVFDNTYASRLDKMKDGLRRLAVD